MHHASLCCRKPSFFRHTEAEPRPEARFLCVRVFVAAFIPGIIAGVTFSDNQQFSMRGAQCYFKESEIAKLAEIRKGRRITIQGEVDGLMMNVFVKNSVFID